MRFIYVLLKLVSKYIYKFIKIFPVLVTLEHGLYLQYRTSQRNGV